MNLLKETKKILKENGKTISDIIAVQGDSVGMSVETFIRLSNVEYDSGYGSAQVAEDLVVIGEDWWLERHEYDGSEWWAYKEMPKKMPISDKVYALVIKQSKEDISCGWETLNRLNGFKEKEEE